MSLVHGNRQNFESRETVTRAYPPGELLFGVPHRSNGDSQERTSSGGTTIQGMVFHKTPEKLQDLLNPCDNCFKW